MYVLICYVLICMKYYNVRTYKMDIDINMI